MHILFLSDNFAPEVNAPASRTYEHCRQWVRRGHQVTVVTCAPNFPTGRVLPGYRNRLWQSEDIDGIRVIRVWSYIAANEGFAKRILDYLSYMVSGFLAALFVRRVDVIVGTSPQFFAACAAWATSLFKRRPWVFELRDLWPESIVAVGAMKRGCILRMLEALEWFLYRRADAIVAVTQSFRRRLEAGGIDPAKMHVITNGADLARYSRLPRDEDLARSLGLTGKFVAGYIGTHGMAHGLDTVLDAAKAIARAPGAGDVRILLLGSGAKRAALERRVDTEAIRNVLFLPTVEKSEVVRYWSLLDVSIIHLKRSETFLGVIPSKMFESMAMGRPILLGLEGEAADLLKAHGAGLTFPPEDAAALARDILRLRDDSALRERLSRQSFAARKEFDRGRLADRMLAVLEGFPGRD